MQAELDALRAKAAQSIEPVEPKGIKQCPPCDWDTPIFGPDNMDLEDIHDSQVPPTLLQQLTQPMEVEEAMSVCDDKSARKDPVVAAASAEDENKKDDGAEKAAKAAIPQDEKVVDPAEKAAAAAPQDQKDLDDPAEKAATATPQGEKAAEDPGEKAASAAAPEEQVENPAQKAAAAPQGEKVNVEDPAAAPAGSQEEKVVVDPAKAASAEATQEEKVEEPAQKAAAAAPQEKVVVDPAKAASAAAPQEEKVEDPAQKAAADQEEANAVAKAEDPAQKAAADAKKMEAAALPKEKATADGLGAASQPAQKSAEAMEIEKLREQMAALQARLVDPQPKREATPAASDLALSDLDGAPMDVEDELLALIQHEQSQTNLNAAAASTGEGKVTFVSHKNEGARMGRFMDSQEGQKYPHMLELWQGTPADTW